MTDLSTRILMCAPDDYDVNYVINPWMEGNIHRSSRQRAVQQWNDLYQLVQQHATVELIEPQAGWPDMVFTANAGLVLGGKVVLSRFFHPERQGEEPFFKAWFESQGFQVLELPQDLPFEGAGDALVDRQGKWLWAGYGFRSELASHLSIGEWLDIDVVSLHLIDQRFYHLDTCLCPLAGGYLIYYPQAFDAYSNRLIEMRVPPDRRIIASDADADNFACNAINIGQTIILNWASDQLKHTLVSAGFEPIETPLTEFIKAGGAAKCLTLCVTDRAKAEHTLPATIQSRIVELAGHLLDSGLINQVLDIVTDNGGSFKVLDFELGTQRHSSSTARVQVTAPSHEVMNEIMGQLIDVGAVDTRAGTENAHLMEVIQPGVAPEDFYCSTIYPTEIRVNDQWQLVEHQRMDGTIAVTESTGGVTAQCKLTRDLQVGDLVAVGTAGIRTVRKEQPHERGKGSEEFSFMGSGVSSERKVELVVERVAWDLRHIQEHQGKVVVVAGPVVIHTGGGDHLADLIRQGFVQVLLGGNAIAVHDIEQSLMGTSLGMDMNQGVTVRGGHRHHLRAINMIRRCGSIQAAVEQDVLTSGVMYECVRNKVEFSLAGSIRDDGPLPDTEMDLIQAQRHYAELLRDADLILMLSSMLHSIGVGNMTPAGVKMVCVDINPAVVTKLADRGSMESIGVVTDVGLFLSLLRAQLSRFDESG